ncbi:MAG: hypothetical protein KatS3mg003_1621 [Candidatus Nitrosocaldaceae archaeon]|nr:MAG: hypothetical protein KatS3mg003_1621 [Candidatus Nitrosocaldaceae archaeon]
MLLYMYKELYKDGNFENAYIELILTLFPIYGRYTNYKC